MKNEENIALKSLDIHGFKSFANPTHIDFSEGLNAVLAPNINGAEDLLSAIRWLFGMCGENEFADVNRAEVKASVVDENGEEIEIVRQTEKTASSAADISQFRKFLLIENDTSLAFGKTKIIVTDDKKLAAKANRLIGIAADESGAANVFAMEIEQEEI